MSEIFRYAFEDDNFRDIGDRNTHMWLSLGRDGNGWWFEARYIGIGRVTLPDGPGHLADFARWLLASPPTGPHETEFHLVRAAPYTSKNTKLDVCIYLGREQPDGPEELTVAPAGFIVGTGSGFQVCADQTSSPLDRPQLERAATCLLAAAI
ncbi:hypothetical protein NE236_37025 [Actinoallomurus purpureus]|uniref:hypothetical protein n=1 Tax=Actinoallomurus purpureus TaxID=478114 RepID=UPI002091FB87|nr:hypothetical protein [Actinoallomurus purpureus]MCO6005255.1 hypothetical protein [Actinoallomurus purpureus]MCO6010576.1 hypothetical protein [Actinoallomurus purpureus]